MYLTIGSTDDDLRNERVPARTLRDMLAPRMPMGAAETASASAFVINRADGTVTIVRTSTNRVLPPIAVGEEPWGAAATPDARLLYVSQLLPTRSATINDAVLIARFGTVLTPGTELIVLTNAQGRFATLPEGTTVTAATGQEVRITYTGGNGRDVVLTVL